MYCFLNLLQLQLLDFDPELFDPDDFIFIINLPTRNQISKDPEHELIKN